MAEHIDREEPAVEQTLSELPKVVCAEVECAFYSEDGCTAKEINLTAGHMHTKWEGYRHVWTCRTFEPSPLVQNMFNQLKSYFDKMKEGEYGQG